MNDVRSWLSSVDTLQPPADLWMVATERAAQVTDVPSLYSRPGPRLTPSRPPTGWRRVAVVVVALAVFAVAGAFAWRMFHRNVQSPAGPSPSVSQVDPFSSLSPGWTRLADPPELRCCAATAWTGSVFLVWGGHMGQSDESTASGLIYDPAADTWSPMPEPPTLGPRSRPASVWTGEELLIWGGADFNTPYPYDAYADGAAFDPSTGTWGEPLPQAPIDARQPFAVWTGTEMIVWGSQDREQRRVDGAAYEPASNSWRRIADAPGELTDATAVWTGQEMIVFGAALHGGNHAETDSAIGIAYDPAADSWRDLPESNLYTNANDAIWIGAGLLAWDYNLDSQIYDPATNRWSDAGKAPTDECEDVPTSVWAGVAYGKLCGDLVTFDPESGTWQRIDGPVGFPTTIYGAGDTLLVGGVNNSFGEGADWRFFAYRP